MSHSNSKSKKKLTCLILSLQKCEGQEKGQDPAHTKRLKEIENFCHPNSRVHPYSTSKISVIQILESTLTLITNCVWMNKNSSPKSMTKVYLSWIIMFDMVCEPL